MKGFGIAAFVAMALAGGAEVVTNAFVVAEADGVRMASDGSIHFARRSPVSVRVTARPGWKVNGRRSLRFVRSSGESGTLRVTSVLGEDGVHVPYRDCTFDFTLATNHLSAPVIRADAPERILAMYALPASNAFVSATATSTLVSNGVHEIVRTWTPCPDCGAERDPPEERWTVDMVPCSYDWTARRGIGLATTNSNTWAGFMSKGTDQSISFEVIGQNPCEECVCHASTNTLVDVHELSITNDLYFGLDRTDAGRSNVVTRTAIANIRPLPSGRVAYSWTDCGKICSFTGRTDQASARYCALDCDSASDSYLAEPLTVEASITNVYGLSASATCTTNFTVIKVDVTVDGVGEDKEEVKGAFLKFAPDAPNDQWTEEGTNALKTVSITCEPTNLPPTEVVTITSPEKSLYVKHGNDYDEAQNSIPVCSLPSKKFYLHGHEESDALMDKVIEAEHKQSKAKDLAKYTTVKLNLKEVSFGGEKCHAITKDDGSIEYVAPHWQDNSSPLDGDALDVDDKAYPICFTRNTKMKVSAKWIMKPHEMLTTITVKGDGPGQLDFPETVVEKNESELVIANVECVSPFKNEVDFMDPMMIDWRVSINVNGEKIWLDGGTSSNQTYVTLGDPASGVTVFHTLVHLGCKNALGTKNASDCTSRIWNEFTDRVVYRVDGVQLTYYASYNCTNVKTAELLLHGDGQCGAWADLFIDMRKVQGIDDENEYVIFRPIPPTDIPQDHIGFLIKNWTFSENGPRWTEEYPYLNILDTDFIGETQYRWKYSEVNDAMGIPGQGNSNPASLFNNHQVVINGVYYDPSYGVKYSSLQEIEERSIDGFYIGPYDVLIDEPLINCDLNGDGDKVDRQVQVRVILIKKNQPGLDIEEKRYDR